MEGSGGRGDRVDLAMNAAAGRPRRVARQRDGACPFQTGAAPGRHDWADHGGAPLHRDSPAGAHGRQPRDPDGSLDGTESPHLGVVARRQGLQRTPAFGIGCSTRREEWASRSTGRPDGASERVWQHPKQGHLREVDRRGRLVSSSPAFSGLRLPRSASALVPLQGQRGAGFEPGPQRR
jgi:hypothetical protein